MRGNDGVGKNVGGIRGYWIGDIFWTLSRPDFLKDWKRKGRKIK